MKTTTLSPRLVQVHQFKVMIPGQDWGQTFAVLQRTEDGSFEVHSVIHREIRGKRTRQTRRLNDTAPCVSIEEAERHIRGRVACNGYIEH